MSAGCAVDPGQPTRLRSLAKGPWFPPLSSRDGLKEDSHIQRWTGVSPTDRCPTVPRKSRGHLGHPSVPDHTPLPPQGCPAYLIPPGLGQGHCCCLLGPGTDLSPRRDIGPPAALGHLLRPARLACPLQPPSGLWGSNRGTEAPPGRGRVAFYAPSRVNQDWDGPFPAGLPVCVLC